MALAVGLLIGLERGWTGREGEEGSRIAGIRTFGIVGLLGGVAGVFAVAFGGWVVGGGLLALGAVAAAAYRRSPRTARDASITTLTALFADFALAALAGYGEILGAAAGAVIVTFLLGVKPELHGFLRRLQRKELLATIRLLLVSVVVLPVLPDQGFGPYAALNPYRVWWMVVLIAALSYVGYVAVRIGGVRRGVLLTGLFGGLASSTAVALNLARLGREGSLDVRVLATGTVTAAAVMFPRTLAVAGVLAPGLIAPLAAALLPAGAVALGAAAWLARRARAADEAAVGAERFAASNPLDLKTAIQFGALLAVILVLSRAAEDLFGDWGVIALGAASGLADVDAITLSLADAAGAGTLAPPLAVAAILAAAAVNTAVKAGLVAAIAGGRAGLLVALPLAAALGTGAAGTALVAAGLV